MKDSIRKINTQATELKKIFAKHIYHKGLVSSTYKNSPKFRVKAKNKTTQSENMNKHLNGE